MSREDRLETANEIIRIVASHGRRFFSQDEDSIERMRSPRISKFVVHPETGHLWFLDKFAEEWIYVAHAGRWAGFSEGGTLRALVENLRDFINFGARIKKHFGPWPPWVCGGDVWGYGEAAETMRAELEPVLKKADSCKPADVVCPYCGREAEFITGKQLYEFSPEFHKKRFYACMPCRAWVGVHQGTTTPLGRLANAELRQLKIAAHAVFDPKWKKCGPRSRTRAYGWLAEQLGIKPQDCHIGMFDEETCRRAIAICERSQDGTRPVPEMPPVSHA